jgi:hypothetical protein
VGVIRMIRPSRRQSGQLFIRVRIPDELHAVASKQLYSKPLGTDDPAEAMRRWQGVGLSMKRRCANGCARRIECRSRT